MQNNSSVYNNSKIFIVVITSEMLFLYTKELKYATQINKFIFGKDYIK